MDISVIIPVYNAAPFIEKCLVSLFSQTKSDEVEFILVNDCSSDNCIKIAQKVIMKFPQLNAKIIEHDVNRGVAHARETGMKNAVGKYIIHIDSDDWCEPTMLEELFRKANNEDSDIVVCDFWWDYHKYKNYSSESMPNNNIECVSRLLTGKNFTSLWNKLFRRSLVTENNIHFISGVNLGEDALFCYQTFFFAKKISYVPSAYLHYMQNETSLTHNKGNYTPQQIQVTDNLINFFYEQGVSELFKQDIIRQKIFCKMSGLTTLKGDKRKLFINIYPEIDFEIFNTKYPFHIKTLIYLSAKGITLPFDIYTKIKNKYRKYA